MLIGAIIPPISDYYVSLAGSDSNPGTQTSPWLTISKVNAAATASKNIHFRGGDRFEGALTLKSSSNYDSYGTGRACLSGGVPITTWSQVDVPNNIWRASWNAGRPRSLFVNGTRVIRARTTTPLPGGSASTSGGFSTTGAYMATWGNQSDIEMVYYFIGWQNSFVPVASVSGNAITMLSGPWAEFKTNRDWLSLGYMPQFIENAYEIFTANNTPGTYYQDRTAGFVYLIPPAGVSNPNSAEVIAPVLQQVATATGVSTVAVTNLEFAHTTNLDIITDGFAEIQANIIGSDIATLAAVRQIKAAVSVTASSNVSFTGCLFRRTSTAGVGFLSTSTDCSLIGNIICDIGGNGVQIGYATQYGGSQPLRTTITNNFIATCGQEFNGGAGVFQWWAGQSDISHNEVYKLPYTGISLGIGWGRETNPNGSSGNVVSYNDVHDYMRVLDDGGGIYVNSHNPTATVHHNYCHDSASFSGLKVGIYTDDGSQGYTISNNVVAQYGTQSFHMNDNIDGNVFSSNTSDGGSYHVQNGPLYVAPNTYDALNVISTAAARTAGVALGAGIQPAYSAVKAEADILVP